MPRLLALLTLLNFLLVPPQLVDAQETLRVLDTRVAADFPLSVTFHLEAEGPVAITKAELRFRVERRSCAQTESSGFAEFAPDRHVTTGWTWDMRKGGSFPPGAVLRYRWVLHDASGETLETPEEMYELVDDRYPWQAIGSDMLTLYWYRGDQAFAGTLMSGAQETLARLEAFTGTRPLGQTKLFIYGSAEDLQDALVFPQEWTGGVSFTGFDVVAIGISPASLAWGQRAMSHELTHVVIGQHTCNCFRDLPTWLSEGLATYNEDASGEPLHAYASALDEAVEKERLLPVRSLSGSFPTAQEEALLAYGESFSLVQYLTEEYGPEKLGKLLAAFHSGTTADAALEQVYGFDQRGLEEEWRLYIGAPPMAEAPSAQTPVPLVPGIPTFEPFTLSTPAPDTKTPAPEPTLTPTAAVEEPTPAGQRDTSGGGCNGGLPVPRSAGSQASAATAIPLGYLVLAGLAFTVRRRNR